ncbi:mechanosensitive ion channel [Luteimonas sp. SJ-92]|uniref:Small-conductance mechanosensitive channel n=1 Tax=Luteimonas salinisoli TaxID=2752307 RepID=A0A853JHU3_9GAMM|nr:mechanosensitive ion channel domain-containing protein [Luteimonas salinisoli]NZA27988.1 mechanosensitive ion channel [Luteimonas salinisoli]
MENGLVAAVREGAWMDLVTYWGLRMLAALVVFYIGVHLARWLSAALERGMTRSRIESTAAMFLRRVVYVTLLVVLALAVLQAVFGIAMTSMVAVLGAAGLAVGLALKDSLANVASGVMLVSLRPFRVGDIVTINGVTGAVESVSIFQTRLRGADNQTITLPNALITGDSIINLTPDVRRRIELVIGIAYDADIDLARGIAMEIMQSDERVLAEPPPDVLLYALADSSVNLGIRCHVANPDWFVTKCELTERIKKAFDRHGIAIPFPQRDVHMYHHGGAAAPPALPSPGNAGDGDAAVGLDDPEHQPLADPK